MPFPPLPSQDFLALIRLSCFNTVILEYQGEVKITEEKDWVVGQVLVCFTDSYRFHQEIFLSISKSAQEISVRARTKPAESPGVVAPTLN